MSSSSLQLSTIEALASYSLATKYYAIAAFTFVLYDYCLTVGDEVRTIWKKKLSRVAILFFLNRYYTILAFAVVITGFFSPLFNRSICSRYALFLAFGDSIPLLLFPGILMTIRVSAIYQKNKIVAAYLTSLLVAQVGLWLWIYASPGHQALPEPDIDIDAFHFCSLIGSPKLGLLASLPQWLQTLFDASVFGLIIFKTIRKSGDIKWSNSKLMKQIVKDGALYFGVIFTTNLVWALMIMFATPGLKYINGLPTQGLVSVMMNRITINLRTTNLGPETFDTQRTLSKFQPDAANGSRSHWIQDTESGSRAEGTFTDMFAHSLCVDDRDGVRSENHDRIELLSFSQDGARVHEK